MRRVLLPILMALLLPVSLASLEAGQILDFNSNEESGLLLLRQDRATPRHNAIALAMRSLMLVASAREPRRRWIELTNRLKRQHLSIDVPYQLLHKLLKVARAQAKAKKQKQQAEKNRALLESVGK